MPILRRWAVEYDRISAGTTWPAVDFVSWVEGELVIQERSRHARAVHVATARRRV